LPRLSIFGDHADVMACRQTGFAMLCSCNVQEVMDFALITQQAAFASRVPFLHFFDGFRTSHEVQKVEEISYDDMRAMIDESSSPTIAQGPSAPTTPQWAAPPRTPTSISRAARRAIPSTTPARTSSPGP